MKKLAYSIVLGVIIGSVRADTAPGALDLHGNRQPPRVEDYPAGIDPLPDETFSNSQFEPNRDVSDIPTEEVIISPTRSKSVTRTISRPPSPPQQNPAVLEPVIAPMIYPGYRPFPHR